MPSAQAQGQDPSQARLAEMLRSREANFQEQHEKRVQELIVQIQEARQEIDVVAGRLHAASLELAKEARRVRDDTTNPNLMYASAHTRLAGAMNQGVRRTAPMDRFLNRAAAQREEAQRREEREREQREIRAQSREVQRLKLPTSDDFEELYGTPEVTENAIS